MDSKEIVLKALRGALVDRDVDAVRRYWSEEYLQHSPMQQSGRKPIEDWVAQLATNDRFRWESARVLAQGDFVVAHSRFTGFMDSPVIAFNLFRVSGGRLAEHWEAVQPEVTDTASGQGMLDGPTKIEDLDKTQQNDALVRRFLDQVLVKGRFDTLGDYFDGDAYIQHNPQVPDGLSGLGKALEAMAAQGQVMTFRTVHRVVAEGNFVFSMSEGSVGDAPFQFFDLFRIEDGVIAEHWDVMAPIPAELPHENGVF